MDYGDVPRVPQGSLLGAYEFAYQGLGQNPQPAIMIKDRLLKSPVDESRPPARESLGHLGHLVDIAYFFSKNGWGETWGSPGAQIASLSGGACLGFDLAAIEVLKQLLGAIAVFATGGLRRKARRRGAAACLTAQIIMNPEDR